jgi:cellulose synthase/poly-beta-1,6-N-acetylglucosamine synthase-like glycosyltransferase
VAVAATQSHTASLLYLLYLGVSLVLGGICWSTLVWMLDAWRTPDSPDRRLAGADLQPEHSFSLIVPARHEEAVLEATLSRLVTSDHPAFEVLVVVGVDDPATREVAERVAERHPELVKVVVDAGWPKNKPRALNAALPHCSGAITGVFDAEDVVHPALLRKVDQCFQRTNADVVQAGVQLMNFRSSWLTVRNVLEYYFWFRSRLHLHARQGFIPLGGNTVFVRTQILRAVAGWDPDCLAEDCELGVRLSALGAHTVVVYESELVTREECPPTLGAFARQRTRWNQGYLQTLSRGYWRRLPLAQRALGAYILTMPYVLALAWLMIPVAIATAIVVKAPVPVTLVSFLPALPMVSIVAVEVAGLGDFCRRYGERARPRDYGRLVLGLPLYQAVLAFAAARAVAREAVGARGWEKTTHLGLHMTQPADDAVERSDRSRGASSPRRIGSLRAAALADGGPLVLERPVSGGLAAAGTVDAPADGWGNGQVDLPARPIDDLFEPHGPEPLWVRLHAVPAGGNGSAAPSIAGGRLVGLGGAGRGRVGRVRATAGRTVTARLEVALPLALVAAVGVVQATNMLHWPDSQFDEGTYVGNAWAVGHGALAPYTYTYGHPPLAWLVIFLWTWAAGIFGHGSYSIDTGRELMLVVSLVSCWLVYALARRLGMGRAFAAGAVLLFGLPPLAIFFHRAVLLDNPATAWVLGAFVLALSPGRRLWAFAAAGACFAAAVLSKETTLVLLPALLLAAVQNADRRTRRYCLTLFVSFSTVIALAFPLYAVLKGELLPGPGHVSLFGAVIVQLFTRQATGSVFDAHSGTHATVAGWLQLDPWLLGGALVLAPIALARRSARAVAVAYLIQVAMILRPGYLPAMYVIGMLPFAALTVAGSCEALWQWRRRVGYGPKAARLSLVAIGALAVVVGLRWADGDRAATSVRADGTARAAKRWLVQHVGHDKRLIVSDEFWIHLIDHGFDAHPVRGGFFSRTVVSYWPFDYDPAVRKRFPGGWRDFDYIVSTEPVRSTLDRTPRTAEALDHSRVVVTFGRGERRIEIRKIDHGPAVKALPMPRHGQEMTIQAGEDAMVDRSRPSQSFAGAQTGWVDGSPVRRIAARFDVPPGCSASKAFTDVWVTSGESTQPVAVHIASDQLTGAAVTWDTRPARAGLLGESTDLGTRGPGRYRIYLPASLIPKPGGSLTLWYDSVRGGARVGVALGKSGHGPRLRVTC